MSETPLKLGALKLLDISKDTNILSGMSHTTLSTLDSIWNYYNGEYKFAVNRDAPELKNVQELLEWLATGEYESIKNEEDLYLQWSIIVDEGIADEEYGGLKYANDYRVDMPDGVYEVYYSHNVTGNDKIGVAKGVTIKDGMFIPAPTLRACAIARNGGGYHGSFLEALEWDSEKEMFSPAFGS